MSVSQRRRDRNGKGNEMNSIGTNGISTLDRSGGMTDSTSANLFANAL
jgi:hypothetical protein